MIGQACIEVFISIEGAGIGGRFSMELFIKKFVTMDDSISLYELESVKRSTLKQSAAFMHFISHPVMGLMIPTYGSSSTS